MSAVRLKECLDDRTAVMQLSVDQYHQMIEAGILPEGAPYELLDGLLVHKDRSAAGADPMTVGPDHAMVIRKLTALSPRFKRAGCVLQVQLPVMLPPFDEPEPDASVLVGPEEKFTLRHPAAAEVLCAIEVADSSLTRDRTLKQRIYAVVGISQYVIVNLPDRVVEVYTAPNRERGRYQNSVTLLPGRSVEFPTGGGNKLIVPVRSLLPLR